MLDVHADRQEDGCAILLPHERRQLLEALRRDMRQELGKARANPAAACYHLANYRMDVRLLETLNPRRERRP